MTLGHFFSLPSDFKCMEALGMESGEIHSDQIIASSQYSTNWSSERSRLNYPENGWTPGEDSYREWIQVGRLRPGTFRVEDDLGHLERLLKKYSAWQVPSDEKKRLMGTKSLWKHVTKAHHQKKKQKTYPYIISENPCIFSNIYIGLFTEFKQRCLTLVTLKDLIFPPNYTLCINMLPTSTDVYFLDEIY